MRRSFGKAALVSLAAYGAAVSAGFLGSFRITLFAVLALQGTWTLFCVARTVQLRMAGSGRPGAIPYDRASYGFALGGAVSSLALLAVIIVLSQAV